MFDENYFLGKKPFECSVCSARFNDSSTRRRHEQKHHGILPKHTTGNNQTKSAKHKTSKQSGGSVAAKYMCALCMSGFSRALQLRNHLYRLHNVKLSETIDLLLPEPQEANELQVVDGSDVKMEDSQEKGEKSVCSNDDSSNHKTHLFEVNHLSQNEDSQQSDTPTSGDVITTLSNMDSSQDETSDQSTPDNNLKIENKNDIYTFKN